MGVDNSETCERKREYRVWKMGTKSEVRGVGSMLDRDDKDEPEIFFSYFRKNLDCRTVEPNDAHRMLAEMEKRGKLMNEIEV